MKPFSGEYPSKKGKRFQPINLMEQTSRNNDYQSEGYRAKTFHTLDEGKHIMRF